MRNDAEKKLNSHEREVARYHVTFGYNVVWSIRNAGLYFHVQRVEQTFSSLRSHHRAAPRRISSEQLVEGVHPRIPLHQGHS
jgi:response regulator RpfG family c-di-GMP phosphodiesterase